MGKLKVTDLGLGEIKIVEPIVYGDNRGNSFESYSVRDMREAGIDYDFCLDYQAYNKERNTLRGIHFQTCPHVQAKLVRVLTGSIMDYVIDLRKDSPDFKKWKCIELSAQNNLQIVIPVGFGHAFVTLEDDTRVLYKFSDYYDFPSCRTIRWNDPELAIEWLGSDFILSEKDRNAPVLKNCEYSFAEEDDT